MAINQKLLSITTLNANSIISNDRRFNLTKHIEQYQPDIILISETKLNEKHKLTFANYNLYRQD